MKNILILSAALLTLASCGLNNKTNTADTDTTATDTTAAPKVLTAKMYIKDTIKVGEPVLLKFKV